MTSEAIAIIGAGLAGLSAAYTLEQLGYQPQIFEADVCIGGRLKTDTLDSYILDHGFHLILSSYSEIFSLVSKKELELGYIPSGAMIQHHGEWITLLNPIKDPERLVFGKEPFFFDFLKLSRLYLKQKLKSDTRLSPDPKPSSTWEMLKKEGISDTFIQEALRPFFGALFLDIDLLSSSLASNRILRYLIEGKAGLPRKGIASLPDLIFKKLIKTTFHLDTKIIKIEKKSLYTKGGKKFEADGTILAVDLHAAAAFIPPLSERKTKNVTQIYFSLDEGLIEPAPFLYLNHDLSKPINHFCFNNLIQTSYAPSGKLLVSATIVDPTWQRNPKLTEVAAEQLGSYFNTPPSKWEHLKTYSIPDALPDQSRPPLFHGKYCYNKERRIYLCGEAVDPPSFNDALLSGRRAAEILHADLQNKKE